MQRSMSKAGSVMRCCAYSLSQPKAAASSRRRPIGTAPAGIGSGSCLGAAPSAAASAASAGSGGSRSRPGGGRCRTRTDGRSRGRYDPVADRGRAPGWRRRARGGPGRTPAGGARQVAARTGWIRRARRTGGRCACGPRPGVAPAVHARSRGRRGHSSAPACSRCRYPARGTAGRRSAAGGGAGPGKTPRDAWHARTWVARLQSGRGARPRKTACCLDRKLSRF